MESGPIPDPPADGAAELAALAAGLAAHIARLGSRGRKRTAGRPAAAAPERGSPPAAARTPLPSAEKSPTAARARAAANLGELRQAVAECRACGLCATRTQTVFSDGPERARVLFVGEAPGAEEDRQGVPFVGAAGKLLSDIIAKGMGLDRTRDVYIANVLKCRPPENRDPEPGEKELCAPYLFRQIELVDPDVVIPLGRHAAQLILGSDAPMSALRGRVHLRGRRAVVPTYHPAYLLRNPAAKRETWVDIRLALSHLGLPIPGSPGPRPPAGEGPSS